VINAATLSMSVGWVEGTRYIALHGYIGDGTIELADFSRDGLIATTTLSLTDQPVVFDVTHFISNLEINRYAIAGFNIREDPATATNSNVLFFTMGPNSPVLTIDYSLPPPPIELNVTKAEINFESRKSQLADVEIQAELYAMIPAATALVAMYLDGAEVFAVPFGDFVLARTHGQDVPGVYKLDLQHLKVKIDFVKGRLAVDADKVRLTGFDISNGVDCEVRLGASVDVDNFRPKDKKFDRHYKCYRPEQGKGYYEH